MISKHISEKEATKSITALRLGIDNTPNGNVIGNMRLVAHWIFEQDRGTGGLFLEGNGEVRIRKSETSEIMGKFVADGAVELYHDNTKKLETKYLEQ